MADSPNVDFDNLSPTGVLDLFHKVKQAWAPRNSDIDRAVELREHTWKVKVPKAWQQTAEQHHTSRSKEIPQRVVGMLKDNKPSFSRPNPGDDFDMGTDANQVERFLQQHHRQWDRRAAKGVSAWEKTLDNMVGRGGVCVGSLLAPYHWAGAPMFMDGDQIRQEHWRDSSGKQTDSLSAMDPEASQRAHAKAVDTYRQRASAGNPAGMPIRRRILPPEQSYPLINEDSLRGLFIERKVNTLELAADGWQIDVESPNPSQSLIEFVTPNRCRYWLGTSPIRHEGDTEDGIVTNYGFVPYVYQSALNAGSNEYGSWGMPVLALIDGNIRTYDTLKTFLMNGIHLASFPSWVLEYLGDAAARTANVLTEKRQGRDPVSWDFKPGTIMDFGADRKVVPFQHPGFNPDFWKALAAEEAEMDRIIPRSLTGDPASSGFNSQFSATTAKALFVSLFDNSELLLEQLAEMDLRHLETLGGPVYLNWEKPSRGRKKLYERVAITPEQIDGYYEVDVQIGRVIDHITEGTFRANMVAQGIGDTFWAAEGAGIEDPEDMVMRQARDHLFKSPTLMAPIEQEAAAKFGLIKAQQRAQAAARIQQGPDGTPMVTLPGGRTAGPGLGVQTPQGQAGAGMMGGANNNTAIQSAGGPNLPAVVNPTINQPIATAQNRPRSRRRGGAIPGAPQHRNQPAAPYNPATPKP